MTNYLPHSSKKIAILQRRELALFKLIHENATHKKIVDAAERVRDARIRAIEARIASDGPRAGPNIHDTHIDLIRDLPVETILAFFGYSQISEMPPRFNINPKTMLGLSMKHDFREHHSGDEGEQFLAWLESETIHMLRRAYGDGEATKSAIFLFANRAYEARLPETEIGDLFGRCVVLAGIPPEDEEATFCWLEHFGQTAAKVHRDSGEAFGGT